MNKANLNIILLMGIAAIVGFLLSSQLQCNRPKTYLKEYLAAKDSSIKQSERRFDVLQASAKEDREAAQHFKDKDTVYIRQLISNDKKIKDVINSVRDASKDELRSYRPED